MSRNFKLAILRARHDTAIAKVSDDACRRFLIEASDRSAVLQYWADATMGYLGFPDVWMFPWVDITADAAKAEQNSRTYLATAAVAATTAAGHDLTGYDGVLVLTPPGTKTVTAADGTTTVYGFDGGASVFVQPGDLLRGKGFCVVHTTSDHTFVCHELGHVIGYGHSHGLLNNGADWAGTGATSTEYGSPYDIMSAATFGSRWKGTPTWSGAPQFARTDLATAIPGWPGTNSWDSLGPLPSRAFVYVHERGALEAAGQVRAATIDGTTPVATAVLWSAGRLSPNRTALLVVEDRRTTAVRTYCVEYRGVDGWDRGLETSGGDLARRAVVVHSIEGSGAAAYPFYRGSVVVPLELDTDVAIPGSDLALVVSGVAADRASVNVAIRAGVARQVTLTGDTSTEERVLASELRTVHLPGCGSQTFPWHTSITRASFAGAVTCRGFGAEGTPVKAGPSARWVVGGVELATPGVGTITAATTAGGTVSLEYDLGPRGATLALRGGWSATAWTVDVVASVREADGSAVTSSLPYPFVEPGTVEGFDASFGSALRTCIPVEIRKFRRPKPGCWPEDVRIPIIATVIPAPELPVIVRGHEPGPVSAHEPGSVVTPSEARAAADAPSIVRRLERVRDAARELLAAMIRPR